MLKKFSLMKQLLIVFGIIAVLFIAVLVPIVDKNLNSVIDSNMYQELKLAQENAIAYSFFPNDKRVKRSYHLIYDISQATFTFQNLPPDSKGANRELDMAKALVMNDLNKLVENNLEVIENKGEYDKETVFYRIIPLNESSGDTYLITMMSSDYSKALINDFRNRVIYIQYGSLLLLAIIMMAWAYSLIKPLRKIKGYVDSIKNRESQELNINRGDEIGIVATALVDMREEIEHQEKTKEEMIHNISHDLKTPIALIKSYGQSVKDDIYPYGDKDASMDVILENTDRLEHRVKDLLYLNRLDYLKSEDRLLTPLDMKELIEHIVSQMDQVLGVEIITDLDDVSFIGDAEHWRVAIENILQNAKRYVKSKIIITLKEGMLKIYNDGDKIPEESLEDLFKPYVKGVKGQFGLGLSIVSKIADMYGYDVKAENEEVGVSFTFTKIKTQVHR